MKNWLMTYCLVLTAEGTNPSQREKAPSVFVKLQNKKNLDQDLSSIWNGTWWQSPGWSSSINAWWESHVICSFYLHTVIIISCTEEIIYLHFALFFHFLLLKKKENHLAFFIFYPIYPCAWFCFHMSDLNNFLKTNTDTDQKRKNKLK